MSEKVSTDSGFVLIREALEDITLNNTRLSNTRELHNSFFSYLLSPRTITFKADFLRTVDILMKTLIEH